MKHFGISTLMAGCLLWTLLDVAPIPTGNRCKDKKQQKEFEQYVRNRNRTLLTPLAKVSTEKVKAKGSTWVELSGTINPFTDSAMSIVKEYGFSYKENKEGSQYINVPADNIENGHFTVKITGLSPGTEYTCRTYMIVKDQPYVLTPNYYGYNIDFTTDKEE